MICLIFAKLKGSSLGLSSRQKILSFLLIHSITFKPNKGRGRGGRRGKGSAVMKSLGGGGAAEEAEAAAERAAAFVRK